MAIIDEKTQFDPDEIAIPVVGIAAAVGKHDSGMHRHQKGQLLYAPQGCMHFALQGSICVLPPSKAVWIPGGVEHRAIMSNVVEYRSLYFDSTDFHCLKEIAMIEVNELLKSLINTMALWPWDKKPEQSHYYTQLFWHEFEQAKRQSFFLPLPSDKRLTGLLREMNQEDYLLPELNSLAQSVGASSKTLTRLFKTQTGMTYQEWKQQWRLLKAIQWLCQARQVTEVAYRLNFSSDSAFIAFFKKQTGMTPLSFLKSERP
tara:strand:+ start:8099 stop:8875 length:777 start_codon:yes stop_codon:yes gene_type:complete